MEFAGQEEGPHGAISVVTSWKVDWIFHLPPDKIRNYG